jgi:peptidoglycan/LPS O-acetylase OafA/YrhL
MACFIGAHRLDGRRLVFVISGFVITNSAWHPYETEGAGWQAHYWRRRLTLIVSLYLLTLAVFMTAVTPEWLSIFNCGARLAQWHALTVYS